MANNTGALPLTLRITTPDKGTCEIFCDSITLTLKDAKNGKGGGSYGIHKGHAPSVFATQKGDIRAFSDGNIIFSECFDEGFATLKNNILTVITAG